MIDPVKQFVQNKAGIPMDQHFEEYLKASDVLIPHL
jgi:hypothetical protein